MIKYEAMKKVVEEEKARQNNTTSYYFMLQSSLPHLKASFSGFGSEGNRFYYINSWLVESIHLLIYRKAKKPLKARPDLLSHLLNI